MMKRIVLALAATLAFLLPASAAATDAHSHATSHARGIDWD